VKESRRARSKVSHPTLEEVKQFCSENHLVMDPEECFDHYQGNGWVQGHRGKPVVDWRSTVRNWARREKKFSGNGSGNGHAPAAQKDEPDFVVFNGGRR